MRTIHRALGALLLAGSAAGAQAPGYHVTKTISVPGDGFWDYVEADPAMHRLYVSHNTQVVVIDTRRDSVIGTIQNTPGVHGVALAPELNRGFTSNGRDSTVTVFNLKTLAPIRRVKVTGANPDAILYEPVTRQVFTFNGQTANATVLNARTLSVAATIPLGSKPEFAQADGRGNVYVNIEPTHQLVWIDARAKAVKGIWVLDGCEEPSGLAIDTTRRRLFSVCGNGVMVVTDINDGHQVAQLPIGHGADAAKYDPALDLAFSSNGGDGTLTVVGRDGDTYKVMETVPTERGARTMAVDVATHRIFLPTAEFEPAPAAAPGQPRQRPGMKPGTFHLVVVERQ